MPFFRPWRLTSPPPRRPLANEFSWSRRREEIFRACPRKYYYHYYASWRGWEPGAPPRARELYLLRHLTTAAAWVGGRLHEAVGAALENRRRGVRLPGPAELVDRTLKRMRAEFEVSREGRYRLPLKTTALFEHEYGAEGGEELWRESAARLARCLTNFFASAAWAELREAKRRHLLAVDDLGAFTVGGTPVYVHLDCARRLPRGGGVVVYDWRTGRASPSDASSLGAGWARYARHKWGGKRTEVRFVDLYTPEERPYEVSRADVRAWEAAVAGSAADMRSLLADAERNVPREEEDFVAVADERVCARCNFRRACEEGGWE